MADPVSIVIIPALIMGAVIGLVELFFVHNDEVGMNWLLHGLHALPIMMIFIFISMNISYVAGLINFDLAANFWIDLGVRILIGIVAMVKIAGSAAIAKGSRVGEKWYHVLIIGILIMGAPYIWEVVSPYMPSFLQ